MKELVNKLKENSISIKSVADKFGVSRPTIYSWIKHFENDDYEFLPKDVYFFFREILGSTTNKERNILEKINDFSLKPYGPNDGMFLYTYNLLHEHFVKIKNHYIKSSMNSAGKAVD